MTAVVAPSADLVRVITTIGHVDHGKTTFVDSLLAANNIISTRLAGKIRYMDSREDEQQRGITMESSAVSLHFKVLDKPQDSSSAPQPKTYTVNLIDTPGHVDFSSEVSTAARLCDGALVIVDAVEGVCTQTITVLRQAWLDRLKPILVVNKFDRLVTELKLTPAEGYQHLVQLIEEVNAVMGSFFAAERLEDDLRWREEREKRLAARKAADADTADAAALDDEEFAEKDDEDIYFAPDRGNVIFASAIDGWGFRVGKFAQLYAQKLGVKEANLRRVLWGDFYLDPKTKRVISHKQLKGRNLKPLFVQFVLDNIWAVYENVVIKPNPEKIEKIVSALSLKILPRDLKSKDARHVLSLIFGQWLSLSTCTVQAVIDVVPPPSVAQRTRIPKMLYPDLRDGTLEPKNELERDLYSCNAAEGALVVGYVSKMFAVPRKELPETKRKPLTAEEMRARGRQAREAAAAATAPLPEAADPEPVAEPPAPEDAATDAVDSDEALLGFARLYSGTLRVGASLLCVLPKYKAELGREHPRNAKHLAKANVAALYVMMGRELVPVQSVSAGNVFAIAGLDGKVWRSATLCGAPEGQVEQLVNLGSVVRHAPPIVRVALEPVIPSEMPMVVRGLKLLSQADPCVETFQQQTGEHVILTAGELHLERCLKDLRERFAKVEIQASEPIVPFRETAVRGSDMPPPKAGAGKPRGTVNGASFQSFVKYTVRTTPLPEQLTKLLTDNIATLQRLHRDNEPQQSSSTGAGDLETEEDADAADGDIAHTNFMRPEDFTEALKRVCKEVGGEWADAYECIWHFGPRGAGPNILLDRRPNVAHRRHFLKAGKDHNLGGHQRDFEDAVELGFQMATFQGPLCAEPVHGMALVIESLEYDSDTITAEAAQSRLGQVLNSLTSNVREACRSGLLDWSPRLMLAMYSCEIQASTEVLGKMYGVLARRRGRIMSEEIKEGTSFFTVRAMLPVVESFGFAEDIRKKTSGAASPQLVFSGYELLDEDPYWVPTTEEELEDLGEKADRANVARGYMDAVRARKGMFVEKKIVEFAEKQRTLKR